MIRRAIRRSFSCAAVVVMVAVWTPAELERRPVTQGDRVEALAPGKLLVASRGLVDPNFAETVVLLLDHTSDGAAGLVVNVRTDVPVARVFERLGLDAGASNLTHYGGPVSVASALGLARSPEPLPDARPVAGDIQLVVTRELMEEMLVSAPDPARFRLYLGRAGWGPGQLERELLTGAWHVFDAEADTVFDPDPAAVWPRLILRTESLMVRRSPPSGPPETTVRLR